ncbi:MAG: PH domain-containing protein [Bacteroides sp.]|nr:PH domain-containing protein [Bacteroides sp.]MCM1457647.1 PH domain-containing protein [Lachnoclostridium sp.]
MLFSKSMLGKITYTIDGGNLILYHQIKTKTIPIESIFKVRRGKFWVERGKNYSAAYTKLRILYGKNQYVYVSPVDEARFVSELQKINPAIAFSSERGVNP